MTEAPDPLARRERLRLLRERERRLQRLIERARNLREQEDESFKGFVERIIKVLIQILNKTRGEIRDLEYAAEGNY